MPSAAPEAASSAIERWLIVVFLAGLVLRIGWGAWTLFPVESMALGDAWTYWTSAKNLLEVGLITDTLSAGSQYTRPPLYVAYLAALMAIVGKTPWAVMVANAALGATGSVSSARIAQRCWPRVRWLPAAAATLYALDPIQAAFPGSLLSESLTVPAVLAFAWLLLVVLARPSGPSSLALGVAGGVLVYLRVDFVVIAIGGSALGAWVFWRRGRRRPWRPWLAASALTLALCVPWSLHASRALGRPTFMASVPAAAGLDLYTTTLRLSLNAWLKCEHGYVVAAVDPQLIPADAFRSAEEEAEVRAMLAEVRRHPAPPLAIDDRLRALARARIAEGRLRYYVGLPLWRSLQLWLHFEKGLNRLHVREGRLFGETPDLFRGGTLASSLWCLPYAILSFLGFLASWAVFARSRGPRAVVAGLILGRTYSLLVAGLVAGRAAYEVRYLTQVQPLAILLALGVGASLWAAHKEPDC